MVKRLFSTLERTQYGEIERVRERENRHLHLPEAVLFQREILLEIAESAENLRGVRFQTVGVSHQEIVDPREIECEVSRMLNLFTDEVQQQLHVEQRQRLADVLD